MARNEPMAKEVQQAYQRPAEISNNAIRVGRYQLEELLGNFILEETERKNQHPKSAAVLDTVHVTNFVQSRHCTWRTDSFTFVRVVPSIFFDFRRLSSDLR